jgi:hypothetical protein
MDKTTIEQFLNDFGEEIEPGDDEMSSLYVVGKDEQMYSAEWRRNLARPVRRRFFIQLRDAVDAVPALRADTVVLRSTTLLALYCWKRAPVPVKNKDKNEGSWAVDITEVSYQDVLSLRCRRVGLTDAEVAASLLF